MTQPQAELIALQHQPSMSIQSSFFCWLFKRKAPGTSKTKKTKRCMEPFLDFWLDLQDHTNEGISFILVVPLNQIGSPFALEEKVPAARSLYVYSIGRESEIWERAPGLYNVMPSERTLHLAEPRQFSPTYLKQRPRSSPLWPVSMAALSYDASVRTLDLSQPRPLHPCFTLPKQAETVVTRAAMSATTSPRIRHLAQPVIKKSTPCYDNRYFEAEIRQVSKAAKEAVASPRTAELARSKGLPPGSLPDRPATWPVSEAAKHAVATPRLEELAQPPKRAPTNLVQFDPEAFIVKEAAKKAVCSERIKQLAQPVQR